MSYLYPITTDSINAADLPSVALSEEVSELPHPETAVVTGSFSYTGRYITQRLLDHGVRVSTLTRRSVEDDPFAGRVPAAPFDFQDEAGLRRALDGAGVLYNTYWVRYGQGTTTFQSAVANSRRLFEAARDAGVGKIVHISVTNASTDSSLLYFKGKGEVEEALAGLGVPYAIIRPTMVFSERDVLVNDLAWALRRFPVFPLYGRGDYVVQPIHVEDVAEQAVAAAQQAENSIADAAGPETFTFAELLRLLASSMGVRCTIMPMPPILALSLTRFVGFFKHDVPLVRDELDGLMASLLASHDPPTGTTRLSNWIAANANTLGRQYVSELNRNFRR